MVFQNFSPGGMIGENFVRPSRAKEFFTYGNPPEYLHVIELDTLHTHTNKHTNKHTLARTHTRARTLLHVIRSK